MVVASKLLISKKCDYKIVEVLASGVFYNWGMKTVSYRKISRYRKCRKKVNHTHNNREVRFYLLGGLRDFKWGLGTAGEMAQVISYYIKFWLPDSSIHELIMF